MPELPSAWGRDDDAALRALLTSHPAGNESATDLVRRLESARSWAVHLENEVERLNSPRQHRLDLAMLALAGTASVAIWALIIVVAVGAITGNWPW